MRCGVRDDVRRDVHCGANHGRGNALGLGGNGAYAAEHGVDLGGVADDVGLHDAERGGVDPDGAEPDVDGLDEVGLDDVGAGGIDLGGACLDSGAGLHDGVELGDVAEPGDVQHSDAYDRNGHGVHHYTCACRHESHGSRGDSCRVKACGDDHRREVH